MRIVVTADLHYDIARSRRPSFAIAEEICKLDADALLVLGDVAGRDVGIVRECLRLFDRFTGRKFFVAGNHDIWTGPGCESLEKLEHELPAACRDAGFHPLDVEPVAVNGVGVAGAMGWYDFSYRPARLGIPLRFYEAKIAPGAAARSARHAHLVADRSDTAEEAFQIGTRWMDGEHARLPMSDVAFCKYLLDRFDDHLRYLSSRCDRIVVGLHHVPFSELVPCTEKPGWAFARAFLGTELFGDVMFDHPKIRYAFCGHSHKGDRIQRRHIECVNVGCTYRTKRYEIVTV